jgi:hypothetical protein
MAKPYQNPFTKLKEDILRTQRERTTGVQIFRLGPNGESTQNQAAEIDAAGNLIEYAQFDVDRFDVSGFAD